MQTPHAGDLNMDTGAFGTWFWKTWFSFDHVHLGSERIGKSSSSIIQRSLLTFDCLVDYLQHRFAGRKCHYARNEFLVPWLVQIPYYIYLGDKQEDVQKPLAAITEQPANFRLEHGLLTPNSPWQKPKAQDDSNDLMELSLGASALDEISESNLITRTATTRVQSIVSVSSPL